MSLVLLVVGRGWVLQVVLDDPRVLLPRELCVLLMWLVRLSVRLVVSVHRRWWERSTDRTRSRRQGEPKGVRAVEEPVDRGEGAIASHEWLVPVRDTRDCRRADSSPEVPL